MIGRALLGSAMAFALVSCGGGGGSAPSQPISGAPTPSPTPAPTPTPTTNVLATGEVKPTAGSVFIAASLELDISGGYKQTNGVVTAGFTFGRIATLDTPKFAAGYSAGYQLSDAVNAANFGQAQLASDDTSPNGNGTVLFTNVSTAMADYLALYQASIFSSSTKGAGYTTAKYGGAGGWQHTVGNGNTAHSRLNYFAYGSPTPASAMPTSGIVRYTVLKNGNYATDSDLMFLTQGSSEILTVNFDTRTVTGQMGIVGQNFFKNQVGSVGGFPVKATIVGNSAVGTFADAGIGPSAAVPGSFRILFVGPNANEIVVTFVAMDGSLAAVGAGVGVIDQFLGS